jgi:hypothetical protein
LKAFWNKVYIPIFAPDCCWIWLASRDNCGYGWFGIKGKLHRAHRVSWIIHNGLIPDNIKVCHNCDNPACVNPAHLFLATQTINIADRESKNRTAKGEKLSKLSETQVKEIRQIYQPKKYGYGCRSLAKKYGVSKQTILDIISRRLWKHI